jgi:hypothetical protein
MANGMTLGAVAEKEKLTVSGLQKTYAPYMTEEEYAIFFAQTSEPEQPAVASDSSEEESKPNEDAEPAEKESAEDELEIPPEPKEYPLSQWKPNDSDQDQEAERDELV